MAVARHGTGPRAAFAAIASQIHPVFMLPPLAASWFGAIIAGELNWALATVHSFAIFAAVYTAHVKDGYVDFYRRDEDDDHPLSPQGCRLCLVLAGAGFAACLTLLWIRVDAIAVAATAPTWAIAYLHAPQLDMRTLGVTMGYPVGIAIATLGGHYVQSGTIGPTVVAFALVLLVTVTAIKIVDDEQDYAYDRRIGKPSVAVVLGRGGARRLSFALFGAAIVLVGGFVAVGLVPVETLAAAVALLAVVLIAIPRDPEAATGMLIRGSYVFLALLILAAWL